MFVFNSNANPFILWSRIFVRGAKTEPDNTDPEPTSESPSRPRVPTSPSIQNSPSTAVRRWLPDSAPRELPSSDFHSGIGPHFGAMDTPNAGAQMVMATPRDPRSSVTEEERAAGVTMMPSPQPAVIVLEPAPRGQFYTPPGEPVPSGFCTAREQAEEEGGIDDTVREL
mmetsp:Transcript_25186/g.51197  ORF Transcript_25186/g.51197 Transcript_25186/m.51197 type:complete len:169 (+) Transcript_25186:2-508(+)